MCCSTFSLYASILFIPILRAFSILWLPSMNLAPFGRTWKILDTDFRRYTQIILLFINLKICVHLCSSVSKNGNSYIIKLYCPGEISANITGREISTESIWDSLIDEKPLKKSLTATSSRVMPLGFFWIYSSIFVILNSKMPFGNSSSPVVTGHGVKSLSTFNIFANWSSSISIDDLILVAACCLDSGFAHQLWSSGSPVLPRQSQPPLTRRNSELQNSTQRYAGQSFPNLTARVSGRYVLS